MTGSKTYTVRLTSGATIGPLSLNKVKSLLLRGEIHEEDRKALVTDIFASLAEKPELMEQLAKGDTSPEDLQRTFHSLDILQGIPPAFVIVSSEDSQSSYMGQLLEVPCPRLLYFFHTRQLSGRLHLIDDSGITCDLFFARGHLEHLSFPEETDDLPERLLARGICSREQIKVATELYQREGGLFSNHLVAHRFVSPHQLLEVLHEQFRERLLQCFSFWEGRYFFYGQERSQSATIPFSIELFPIIQLGIERYYDLRRLQWVLEPYYNTAARKTVNSHIDLDQLRLSPRQTRLLHLLEQSKTLWSFIEQTQKMNIADELTTHQFVFFLAELELLLFDNHTLGTRIQDKLNLLEEHTP